jgi:hypothetical protein
MKRLFFKNSLCGFLAIFYSASATASIHELNKEKDNFFSQLIDQNVSNISLYHEILEKPYLLQGPIKFNPCQTAATICINTKRYGLLLQILNNNIPIDLITQSKPKYTKCQARERKLYGPCSTPLSAICSQHDPICAEIRAQVIYTMLKKNPGLASIPDESGTYPIEKCYQRKTTHSLLAFGLKPEDLYLHYQIPSYRHNPYQSSNESSPMSQSSQNNNNDSTT